MTIRLVASFYACALALQCLSAHSTESTSVASSKCPNFAEIKRFFDMSRAQHNGSEEWVFEVQDRRNCDAMFAINPGTEKGLHIYFNMREISAQSHGTPGDMGLTFRCINEEKCIREEQYGESAMYKKSTVSYRY